MLIRLNTAIVYLNITHVYYYSTPTSPKQREHEESRQVTFAASDEDISGRVMEMDWGEDEEEVKVTPRDIWDEDTTPRVKATKDKAAAKSAVKNKFADIMAKEVTPPPSPKVILPSGRQQINIKKIFYSKSKIFL